MSAIAVEHIYRYPFPSTLDPEGTARSHATSGARLCLATSGGTEENPVFFDGRLIRTRQTADLLLALGLVARTRFHVPPGMLRHLIALSDPVITSDGSRLRLEAFSSCCGVYARVDLLPGAVQGAWIGRGTTNVDFNAPLRAALTRISDGQRLGLSVGERCLQVQAGKESVVERRVPLPVRWLRGFVEVQAYASRMQGRLEVAGTEARRFLHALPAQRTRGPSFVVPLATGLRVSQRPGKGVCVGGIERLRVMEAVARHARALRVYADEAGQASAWELELENARFTLLLSAEAWRGLSGEGQALATLASGPGKPEGLASLRAALKWQGSLDPAALGAALQLGPIPVAQGLAALGAQGLLGFDLAEGRYFHRELPFDFSQIEKLQPRLAAARKLVEGGEVRRLPPEGDDQVGEVRGDGLWHRVRLGPESGRCTCTWYARHRGNGGPCKHQLALQIALDTEARAGSDQGEAPAQPAPTRRPTVKLKPKRQRVKEDA